MLLTKSASRRASMLFALFAMTISAGYFMMTGHLPRVRLSAVYLAMLLAIGVGQLARWTRRRAVLLMTRVELQTIFLLVWIVFLHMLWYPAISRAGGSAAFVQMSANTLLLPLLMWFLGNALGYSYYEDSSKSTAVLWIGFVSLGVTLCHGLWFAQEKYGVVGLFLFKDYETGAQFDYLRFGDTIAVSGLLLMGRYCHLWKKQIAVYVVTLGMLFFAFSRTSLALFGVCGAVLIVFSSIESKRRTLCVVLLMLILMSVALLLPWLLDVLRSIDPSIVAVRRMTSLVTDPLSDPSLQSRLEIMRSARRQLLEVGILGRYMNSWWESGSAGAYVHNWLSFTIAYGIGPSLVFLAVVFQVLASSWSAFRYGGKATPLVLLLFGVLAITVSRSYVWPYIWFSIGFATSGSLTRQRYWKSGLQGFSSPCA